MGLLQKVCLLLRLVAQDSGIESCDLTLEFSVSVGILQVFWLGNFHGGGQFPLIAGPVR